MVVPSNETAPSPSEGSVDLERDGALATVTFNRPHVRNAVGAHMRQQLITVLDELAADREVRAVIVTGAGSAFCAGGDIADMKARLDAPPGSVATTSLHRQRVVHRFITALHELDKVTVAAVNGPAMGMGCDLALCCDFVLASEDATFGMSYIRRGLIADGGGYYFLPRRVGLPKAKELLFSGRPVDSTEALSIGLADRVIKADQLIEQSREFVRQFIDYSPTALGLAKSILDRSFELDLSDVFALGMEAQAICSTTDEHRAAVTAFLDRKPSRA